MKREILFKKVEPITPMQALDYEAKSCKLAQYIGFGWGQRLFAWYISIKMSRKYKQYKYRIDIMNNLKDLKEETQ